MSTDSTTQLQGWIDRLKTGDTSALDQLIDHAYQRLRRLTHRMLRDFPRVHDLESTGDVLHRAYPRLRTALEAVPLTTVREFLRLAALQVRRELIDLARHYFGPHGEAARRAALLPRAAADSVSASANDMADSTHDPRRLLDWSEFHRCVETLPASEREVFHLLWYNGMTQAEAAAVLDVSTATVKRWWLSARLLLQQSLHGDMPTP
jgi:RNA polymerase sigma-70 factor (ECF subfamily)